MTEIPQKVGRFEVEQRLGQGAMGVVYLATDPVLGRRVAIKCIQVHPGLAASEVNDLRQRFENEARSAANLSHPNLVTIFDAGADDHTLYIAMEYVQGEGLDDIVAADRTFTYKEIADLVLQLAAGLDHAHRQGIVHRDIKPANIMITRDGQPKITDFGVARQAASTLTATGTIIGTPAYMSPEQITGHPISGAADQFSLAIVVYELLTGRKPFHGEGATTVLYKIVHEDPMPPNQVSRALPGGLDEVLLRALSKDPASRYPTCSEFAAALRSALGAAPPDESVTLNVRPVTATASGRPATALEATDPDMATVAVVPGAARAAGPTVLQRTRAERSPGDEPARTPMLPIAAGASALLLVAVVGWWMLAGSGTDLAETPEAAAPELAETEIDPRATPIPAPQLPRPAAAAAAGAAPAPSTPVSLRIVTRPADASVTVDGTRLEQTSPVEFEFSADRRHQLLLERAGHAPVTWAFSLSDLTAAQIESGQLFFPMRALEPEPPAVTSEGEPENAPAEQAAEEVAEELPPVDPVRIRGRIEAPKILSQTRPPFPDWAAESGLPTYVILELVIDREGRVRDASVLNTVHPTLGEMAMTAVRAWRFDPATDNGEAVDVYFNVTVPFETSEDGGA